MNTTQTTEAATVSAQPVQARALLQWAPGDSLSITANQGERDGVVWAVIGDEALFYYAMPSGVFYLGIIGPKTAHRFNDSGYRSVSLAGLSKAWQKAVEAQAVEMPGQLVKNRRLWNGRQYRSDQNGTEGFARLCPWYVAAKARWEHIGAMIEADCVAADEAEGVREQEEQQQGQKEYCRAPVGEAAQDRLSLQNDLGMLHPAVAVRMRGAVISQLRRRISALGLKRGSVAALNEEAAFLCGATAVLQNLFPDNGLEKLTGTVPPMWVIGPMTGRSVLED